MRINSEQKSVDIESRDINYILPPYIRLYNFHSKNEMPAKIVFPMFASVSVIGADRQPISIPIEWIPPESPVAKEIAEDGEGVAEVTPEQEAAIDDKEAEIEAAKAKMAELTEPPTPARCGAYAEHWKELGKPEGWAGCSLPEGHEGAHTDNLQPLPTPAPEDLIRQQEETTMPEGAETEGVTEEEQTYEAAKADQPISPARAAFAVDPDPAHQPPPDRKPRQPPGGDIGPGSGLSDMHGRDRKDQVRTASDLLPEPDIEGAAEKPYEKEIKRDEQGRPIVEEKEES